MRLETLLNWAEKERASITADQEADIQQASREVIEAVRIALTNFVEIKGPKDLFECCEILDKLPLDPRLEEPFDKIRSKLLFQGFTELQRHESTQIAPGDINLSVELQRKKKIWGQVAKLLQILKTTDPGPPQFGPTWIQRETPDIYNALQSLLPSPTGQIRWDEVRALLPADWEKKFLDEKTLTRDEVLAQSIDEYKEIAAALGPEALAEFLIILENTPERDFSKMLAIIAQYLGRSEKRPFDFKTFEELPEVALKIAGFRELVFVKLRDHIYRKIARSSETEEADPRAKFAEVVASAEEILSPTKKIHRLLFQEVTTYFRDIFNISTPARIKKAVRNKKGEEHALPSLRQRMAMKEMERNPAKEKNGRGLICFPAGKGKTASAFLTKEHVGAKKMLYLCPNTNLVGQTADRVKKYYKEGETPTVGTIVAGMSGEDIQKALEQEIVIMPLSMFKSEREGVALTELIKAQPFDFVTVDEVHNVRNEEGYNTQTVYDIVTGIKDLYEKGHIMLLTADPVPNSPEDIVAQLRIYDKDAYGEVTSLRDAIRKKDPLKIRNALLKFMLIPDEPEDWEKFVEYVPVYLSDEENHIYMAILNDETIPLSRKLELLRLAILNPQLSDASFQTEGTMANELTAALEEDLEKEHAIVVAEPTYKGGITRAHSHQHDVPTFVQNIQTLLSGKRDVIMYDAKFRKKEGAWNELKKAIALAKKGGQPPVIIAPYDGDTPQTDRENMLELSKEAEALGIKVVIFALSATIREGINLSHINSAYMLSPEYNHPDLYQYLKRYLRELNTEAKVKVFTTPGMILEGIHLHALQKAILCNRLKYGGTLIETELAAFQEDLDQDSLKIEAGKVIFGTPITDKLLSNKQKLRKIARFLHNRGIEECERVMAIFGAEYAKMYSENWEQSFSANNGRFIAGLIEHLRSKREIIGTRFADIGSGPTVLANTLGLSSEDFQIDNFDHNIHMLEQGLALQAKRIGPVGKYKNYTARMDAIAKNGIPIASEAYDCINLADSLQFTHNDTRKRLTSNERVQTLLEQNRILKLGGVLIITLPLTALSPKEFQVFREGIKDFGFNVMERYTGTANTNDAQQDFGNYTLVCEKIGPPNIAKIDSKKLVFSPILIPMPSRSGKSPERIQVDFKLNKEVFNFTTNADDILLITAEQKKREIENARTFLQALKTQKGGTLHKLTSAEKQTLAQKGLKIFKPSSLRGEWTFSLRPRPERYSLE